MPRIILVSGTPGVGKSTVARRLANQIGYEFLDVTRMVIDEKLHKGRDHTQDSFLIDEPRFQRRITGLLSKHENIVAATHFVEKAFPSSSVQVAIVLRLDPLRLYHRLRKRGWNEQKIRENVESELIDVCLFDAVKALGTRKVFEVDTTSKSPSKIVAEVRSIIQEEPVPAKVNWLRKYDPLFLSRKFRWRNTF